MMQRAVIAKDVSDGNQSFAELQQQYSTYCRLRKKQFIKKRQMRWLDSLTLAAQRCTSWWLWTNDLTSSHFCWVTGWAPSITFCATPRECSHITFQRSIKKRAPEYELPPIHTLATTVQKNISNMSVQSSPGFDPSSTPFIKHAETIQDDRGKKWHTENVRLRSRLIPFLLTCSICSC